MHNNVIDIKDYLAEIVNIYEFSPKKKYLDRPELAETSTESVRNEDIAETSSSSSNSSSPTSNISSETSSPDGEIDRLVDQVFRGLPPPIPPPDRIHQAPLLLIRRPAPVPLLQAQAQAQAPVNNTPVVPVDVGMIVCPKCLKHCKIRGLKIHQAACNKR
jgi:hypothetical protein